MNSKGRSPATIVLALIVALSFVLYMVVFTVSFSETVVVTTFGKVDRTLSDPDWYAKWPWPIQQVWRFDNRLRLYESEQEQLLTSDEQSVTVMSYVSWRVSKDEDAVLRYLKEIRTVAKAEQVLGMLLRDAMGNVVGSHSFEQFVSTDPKKMRLTAIEDELQKTVSQRSLKDYGIEVTTVGIKRLELPEEATKGALERMKQERQQLSKKYRADGKGQADAIIARASQKARDIENRARARAIGIRGDADAQAAQYYQIFAQNPELHNFIKQLEALGKMLPKRTTLILDADRVMPFGLVGSKMMKWLLQDAPSTQETPAK